MIVPVHNSFRQNFAWRAWLSREMELSMSPPTLTRLVKPLQSASSFGVHWWSTSACFAHIVPVHTIGGMQRFSSRIGGSLVLAAVDVGTGVPWACGCVSSAAAQA